MLLCAHFFLLIGRKKARKIYFIAQHCATLAQRAELLVLSSIKILGLYGLVPHKVINPFLKGHPDIYANLYFQEKYLKVSFYNLHFYIVFHAWIQIISRFLKQVFKFSLCGKGQDISKANYLIFLSSYLPKK